MEMPGKWILVATLACVCCAGCNNSGRIDTGGGDPREVQVPNVPAPMARPPVADVPIPITFRIDQKNSTSVAVPGMRHVMHRYHGKSDKWAVGRFFKRHMPANQWTLEADRVIQGVVHLDFSKGSERCLIEIRDAAWWKTQVDVQVYPARGAGD